MNRLLPIVLCLGLTAIGPSSFAHDGHAPLLTRGASLDPATGTLRLSREARQTLDLRTEEVQQQSLTGRWFAYATVESPWNATAYISPLLAGRLVKLYVRPGETVQRGQLLAELDSQELQQLRMEILTARSQHDLAADTESRLTAAVKAGAVPGQQLLEAQSQLAQAANALNVARQQWLSLDLASERFDSLESGADTAPLLLPVLAPIGGVVSHADLSVGKIVDPKEHIFEVVDLRTVWLRIHVLEKDQSRIQLGQPVQATLRSLPGQTWNAAIDKIGTGLDAKTHLAAAWATLSNPANASPLLMPGMTGKVQLGSEESGERLTVPAAAVLRDGAERFVLVEQTSTKDGSEFKKQSVVLGERSAAQVEVRGGSIFPGDRVVTQGGHELAGFFIKGTLTLSPETVKDIGLLLRTAEAQSIDEVFETDGAVDVPTDRRSVVSSPLNGVIDQILIDRAQSVRAGQTVAEVRSVDFQNLQLDLLRAMLEQKLQATTAERLKSSGESIAKRRLIEVEAAERVARLRMDGARQKLLTLGLNESEIAQVRDQGKLLQTLPLRAPIDGVVVGFDKVLGHVVRPDEPLFEIHDLSRSYVEAFLAERDAGAVHVGQTVRVRLVSDPETVLSGKVQRLGHTFGSLTKTLSVWIEIEGEGMQRHPHNSLARVTFSGHPHSVAVAVPMSALIREGNRRYVFVKSPEGLFTRRLVSVGRRDDRFAEILSGLAAGEHVAVHGVSQLQTGYAAIR